MIYLYNMIPTHKLDYIYNALIVGMTLDDAYVYAGLTPSEIVEAKESDELQTKWLGFSKQFEFTLLSKLNQVIDKQVNMGKEQAITWLLEKTNARYTGKPQNELPELHIHIDDEDPADMDTVTIHKPEVKASREEEK